MKKEYVKPTVERHTLHCESKVLAGSVQLEEKEVKAHTENYEVETFDWDTFTAND